MKLRFVVCTLIACIISSCEAVRVKTVKVIPKRNGKNLLKAKCVYTIKKAIPEATFIIRFNQPTTSFKSPQAKVVSIDGNTYNVVNKKNIKPKKYIVKINVFYTGDSVPKGTCSRLIPTVTTTEAPVTTTEAPVTTTEAPVTTTEVPVTTTEAPVTTTEAPVTTTEAPVTTTEVPVTTTEAPVTTTEAPVTTTEAPVTTTEAPVTTTEAPVTTTEAPVTTTEAPVTTTEAPVTTTLAPTTTDSQSTPVPMEVVSHWLIAGNERRMTGKCLFNVSSEIPMGDSDVTLKLDTETHDYLDCAWNQVATADNGRWYQRENKRNLNAGTITYDFQLSYYGSGPLTGSCTTPI